jgi:hypothetical protein
LLWKAQEACDGWPGVVYTGRFWYGVVCVCVCAHVVCTSGLRACMAQRCALKTLVVHNKMGGEATHFIYNQGLVYINIYIRFVAESGVDRNPTTIHPSIHPSASQLVCRKRTGAARPPAAFCTKSSPIHHRTISTKQNKTIHHRKHPSFQRTTVRVSYNSRCMAPNQTHPSIHARDTAGVYMKPRHARRFHCISAFYNENQGRDPRGCHPGRTPQLGDDDGHRWAGPQRTPAPTP